jgi:hypothetical protein
LTGIKICVYICPKYYDHLVNLVKDQENIKILRTTDVDETFVSKDVEFADYNLPNIRDAEKDTKKYMIMMNSKIEFLYDACKKNLWNHKHFAWIDFSISYIFQKSDTFRYLQTISSKQFIDKSFLVIPGCWDKLASHETDHLIDHIHWRFCGGFLLGDQQAIVEMYQYYKVYFPKFLDLYKTLVWEVNFWAWLEITTDWKPTWYRADHNDSIIYVPDFINI